MPNLDALPKDTTQESKAYKVKQKIPTEILMKCNPLDERFHSDIPIPLDHGNITRPYKESLGV